MSYFCSELHRIVHNLNRYRFPFNEKEIPKNGIYIIFEEGEEGHGKNRIVRIGTHTGEGQLRSRLKQHFLKGNKDRSIFRKNIGRCFLNGNNDPYLNIWELDNTTTESKLRNAQLINREYQQEIEARVSKYIQGKFSFCVLEVPCKEDRLYLESRLISTISNCKECAPSTNWLGLSSTNEKIKKSGLWQVNELYKEGLSVEEFDRLVVIIG